MLKLDPEDSDAEMDDGDKTGTPVKPVMPLVDFESTIDSLAGAAIPTNNSMAQSIPANLNNVSAFVVNQNSQYNNSGSTAAATPARVRGSRGTPKKQSTAKKFAAVSGKKKKRRVSSSEDEESDYNSDSDY